MNNNDLKILFCPTHYRFTDKSGSEFYGAYNLANRIAKIYKGSVVVTGKSDIRGANYKIIEIEQGKPDNWMQDLSSWSTLSSIIFAIRYMVVGYVVTLRNSFDLLHHVRPFVFGSTFNLLPLLPGNRNKPFIIGEFCAPYSQKQLAGEQVFTLIEKLTRFFVSLLAPILNFLSKTTLRRADAILVTDMYTKNTLSSYVDTEKIHVIPHAKDKSEYTFDESKFSEQKIKIFFASRLIPRKRVDLAIKAFSYVYSKNNSTELLIAGDGIEESKLKELVESLNLSKCVHFLGNVPYPEMPKYFKQSHLFLHTAAEEVFGQVYIEALASGVPIISTKTIGASHILTPSVGYIEDDDPVIIGNKILELVNNSKLLKDMSLSARILFENTYDYDSVIIPQVIDIYKSVIKKYETLK